MTKTYRWQILSDANHTSRLPSKTLGTKIILILSNKVNKEKGKSIWSLQQQVLLKVPDDAIMHLACL